PERQRLEAALSGARERLDVHDRYRAWEDACRRQAAAAAAQDRHRLDDRDGHERLAATARALFRHPALPEAARATARGFLKEARRARAQRAAFLELSSRLAAETGRRRRTGHEADLARDLIDKVASLVDGPGVTAAERREAETMIEAVEAGLRVRPDRGMRWRL
ncbi:MAG: hypothetical protein OXQ84_13285, partial [bacterium]|nr:hypothetical protein [bacterium]